MSQVKYIYLSDNCLRNTYKFDTCSGEICPGYNWIYVEYSFATNMLTFFMQFKYFGSIGLIEEVNLELECGPA